MDPDRRRQGRAGQPRSGWGAGARPPVVLFRVLLVLLAATLGVLLGISANRAIHARQATGSQATATPPTSSGLAPKTPSKPPSATRSTSSNATTSTPGAPARVDTPILQQRRRVPAGVFAQMLSTQGGADSSVCNPDSSRLDATLLEGPTIAIGTDQRPNFAELEVASPIQLCLWRFAPGRRVEVSIRYPNARTARRIDPPPCRTGDCYSHVNWAAVPGDPLGDYQVTAVQGKLRASGTVRVVAATGRRLLVVGNGIDEYQYQTVRRGQTLRVAMAGYGSRRAARLLVYYTPARTLQDGETALRFRTWVGLRAGSRGGATYLLRTAASDPRGCYALDTRPVPQGLLRLVETDPQTNVPLLNVKASEPLFCLT
jgi:hypothetical protein